MAVFVPLRCPRDSSLSAALLILAFESAVDAPDFTAQVVQSVPHFLVVVGEKAHDAVESCAGLVVSRWARGSVIAVDIAAGPLL